MALILEDGTGVAGANAFSTAVLVNTYLSDRNRVDENGWSGFSGSEKNAFVIAATDFIEQRYSLRFLGNREFNDVSAARATLTFTGQPADSETVTIDTTIYTYNTALGGANSILIGASTDASILNLVNAISANSDEAGVTHGVGTVKHPSVTGAEGIGDRFIAEAVAKGTAGNGIVCTDSVANASWSSATLLGGGDVPVPQSLSFPRLNLLDREGFQVRGMPAKLLSATAEYAVRAAGATLMPDPVIDSSGRTITRKKEIIGPIETDVTFEEGGALSQLIKPYPAADRLLAEYIARAGRVLRG